MDLEPRCAHGDAQCFGFVVAGDGAAMLFGRRIYNARSETAATLPSFRDAWRKGQYCIIPADAIFEPDWRSGKSVPTRISRADGEPMGIAGLWSW